ncbi:MAG: hypothetical protein R3F03_03055 [Opitutaceae bacterium]
MTKVAKELGLSDVAVKKMCTRMDVSTPPRGYWARLAAGQKVNKTPLPKLRSASHVTREEKVDPEVNALRREQFSRDVLPPPEGAARFSFPDSLDTECLHPRARAALTALNKGKAERHGIVRPNSRDLPDIAVSKSCAERVAWALHVIFSELEARGVDLQPVKHYHHTHLGFVRGSDKLGIHIEEIVEKIRREPTPEELRRPSREWNLESYQATGRLHISLLDHGDWSVSRAFQRNESPRRPLEKLLNETVETVWSCLSAKEERREREKREAEARTKAEDLRKKEETERRRIEAQRKAEEEVHRKEAERLKKHEDKLLELTTTRTMNLLRAAQWSQLRQQVLDFLEACALHWAEGNRAHTALTEEQQRWLTWARAEAEAMSPFAMGYPDPAQDGGFAPGAIPMDGPYPPSRELPTPPTMFAPSQEIEEPPKNTAKPEIVPAVPPPPTPSPPAAYQKPQFPYWLLHQRRR